MDKRRVHVVPFPKNTYVVYVFLRIFVIEFGRSHHEHMRVLEYNRHRCVCHICDRIFEHLCGNPMAMAWVRQLYVSFLVSKCAVRWEGGTCQALKSQVRHVNNKTKDTRTATFFPALISLSTRSGSGGGGSPRAWRSAFCAFFIDLFAFCRGGSGGVTPPIHLPPKNLFPAGLRGAGFSF